MATINDIPPAELIKQHYQQEAVKKTILAYAEPAEGFRALNGNTGWYITCPNGEVRLRVAEDFDDTIEQHRTLYATLDILNSSVKHISQPWDKDKGGPVEPIGTLADCEAYSLSADIDSISSPNGGNIINSVEIRTAVEDAAQFLVNFLRFHGVTKSVYCLFSGGGIYVKIHHALCRAESGWSKEHRERFFGHLTKAFNALIAEVEISFFDKYPNHIGKVKFDKINNQKRKFKCIFSVHKRYELAVIPLDPANIKIDIGRAKLPLSDEIVASGEQWYSMYDESERTKLENILKPQDEVAGNKKPTTRGKKSQNGLIEVQEIFRHDPPLEIEAFPPCMRNIINKVAPGCGPHRAMAVLASYLFTAGWAKDDAFKLWEPLASKVSVEPRIFDLWYGKMICPNCETLQRKDSGYPRAGLGGLGYCELDGGCNGWPGNYDLEMREAMNLIQRLTEGVKSDPGLPFEPKYLEALAFIKTRNQPVYERAKAEMRKAKVSMRDLATNLEKKIEENEESAIVSQSLEAGSKLQRRTVILGNDLHKNAKRSLDALYANNNPPIIFQRGGTLCRIKRINDNSFRIEDLSDYALLIELSRAAIFQVYRRGGFKECQPDILLARTILKLPEWDFPALNGLVDAPVVRPDGSLLLEPGYDKATGLFYSPDPKLVLPAIPEKPSREEARKAADYVIDEVLFDFPFCGSASLANTMSMLITPIVRPMIKGCIPLGLVSKPSPGTGATKLIQMVSLISTGKPMKAQTAPTDEEEWRKKITSLLRAGSQLITFDNVDSDLGSGMLASALTSLY